ARDAEWTQQRKAELHIGDQHPAPDQSIDRGARRRAITNTLAVVEASDVIAAHQPGIADIEREDARILRVAAVSAVVHATHGERIEVRRHEIAAIVGEESREVQRAERRRHFETGALTLHRARRSED